MKFHVALVVIEGVSALLYTLLYATLEIPSVLVSLEAVVRVLGLGTMFMMLYVYHKFSKIIYIDLQIGVNGALRVVNDSTAKNNRMLQQIY